MKKLVLMGTIFTLFTIAASAQKEKDVRPEKHRFETGQVTPGDRAKIHKDRMGYKRGDRRFKRDGKFSRSERRKLHKMKRHNRHKSHRFHHNNRNRS